MYQSFYFIFTFARFSPAPVGLFSRSRLRGTQGGRLYTTTQAWIPGGLRDACSALSKSQNLTTNHGVAFREARSEQDIGKPTCPPLKRKHDNNTRFQLSSVLQLRTRRCVCRPLLCMCGHDVCVYALRVCSRVRVCVGTGLSFFFLNPPADG